MAVHDVNLLIADDERIARLFIRHVIEREAAPVATVYEAADGREAVALAVRYKPDLVFLDIRMPELDGLQAAAAIMAELPDAQVVIVTAYGDFDYARTALRAGVVDYLLKPARTSEIMDKVRAAHARKNKLAPPARPARGVAEREAHPLVAAVTRHVAQHLSDKLTLHSIGRAVFASPSYVSRMFKKHTGEALMEYILEQRLSAARDLLARTSLSITEIADRTGFATSAYFAACFHKQSGLSPSAYRRQQEEKT